MLFKDSFANDRKINIINFIFKKSIKTKMRKVILLNNGKLIID